MSNDPTLLVRDTGGAGMYFVRIVDAGTPPAANDLRATGPFVELIQAIEEARRLLAEMPGTEAEIAIGRGETSIVILRTAEVLRMSITGNAPDTDPP